MGRFVQNACVSVMNSLTVRDFKVELGEQLLLLIRDSFVVRHRFSVEYASDAPDNCSGSAGERP